MAKFNASGTSTINVDNAAGTPVNLTAYVKEIDGLEKLYAALDSTALSDTAEKRTIGIQEAITLTIRGDFDDTATTGPHVVLSAIVGKASYTSTITIVLDGTNQFAFEAVCTRYATPIRNKELVQFEATFVSDGAIL